MKRFRAAVLGGSGFAGAELVRRLLLHPDVELVRVGAADHIGEPLSSALPHLEGQTALRFENPSPEQAVEGVDIVLMGLPQKASIPVVEAALTSGAKVIDMSGAFRLRSAEQYARYYGEVHPRPDLLARFVYGLPEQNRDAIRQSPFVASPGCFATTIELGLLPFARAGLLDGPVHSVGITGSSGSGVTPSPTTHHPTRAGNLRTYRPLVHQHTPEVEDALTVAGARRFRLDFVPVSAPLVRGILVTSFVEVPAALDDGALKDIVRKAYARERFVRVPAARLPEVVAVAGSNFAEVGFVAGQVEGDKRTLTVFSALDNLVKGGAGQAIQNMNLMLGLSEATALEDVGAYP
ncbi:MAG TPA: N-acetyl-gamma-glutamyl-phosphate reductase [Polyangiaceae bacterium]|nr:N-acetyl-gamma-glutamyl-phosphate reductase [Polyangiaceae bacterium]